MTKYSTSLFYKGPPIIEELPQQLHAVLGVEFWITCTATNDQDAPMKLIFSWSTPNGVQFNVTTTAEDNGHTATSTLRISRVTHSHAGAYQCIVRNDDHQRNINSVTSTVVVEGNWLSCACRLQCLNYITMQSGHHHL